MHSIINTGDKKLFDQRPSWIPLLSHSTTYINTDLVRVSIISSPPSSYHIYLHRAPDNDIHPSSSSSNPFSSRNLRAEQLIAFCRKLYITRYQVSRVQHRSLAISIRARDLETSRDDISFRLFFTIDLTTLFKLQKALPSSHRARENRENRSYCYQKRNHELYTFVLVCWVTTTQSQMKEAMYATEFSELSWTGTTSDPKPMNVMAVKGKRTRGSGTRVCRILWIN